MNTIKQFLEKEKRKYLDGHYKNGFKYDKNWGKIFYPWIKKQHFNTAVDVGCGNGSFVYDLVSKLGFEKAYGIDIATVDLDIVKKHDRLEYFNSDSSQIPLSDNAVELACSFEVMEHVSPVLIDQTLSEIARVASSKFICCIASTQANHRIKGEPVHLLVKSCDWWKNKLSLYFTEVEKYKTGHTGAAEYGFICTI